MSPSARLGMLLYVSGLDKQAVALPPAPSCLLQQIKYYLGADSITTATTARLCWRFSARGRKRSPMRGAEGGQATQRGREGGRMMIKSREGRWWTRFIAAV